MTLSEYANVLWYADILDNGLFNHMQISARALFHIHNPLASQTISYDNRVLMHMHGALKTRSVKEKPN